MRIRPCVIALAVLCAGCAPLPAPPPAPADAGQPLPGHPGKDVIWVPSPEALVERMLDMAEVGKDDFVMDLGSGDGRIVIAAAKRGAHALGVEYTPELVAMSRRNAAAAGVSERAAFVQGDMFDADISRATALALFLIPANLERLKAKFLALAPGTRIVNNGYRIPGWQEKEVGSAGDCGAWCTAYLYIVPAQVAGKWRLAGGELSLAQDYEFVTGVLEKSGARQRVEGTVQGGLIHLVTGLDEFNGRVHGGKMSGEARGAMGGYWSAERYQ
jgi:SAM-dependent methyltransferase